MRCPCWDGEGILTGSHPCQSARHRLWWGVVAWHRLFASLPGSAEAGVRDSASSPQSHVPLESDRAPSSPIFSCCGLCSPGVSDMEWGSLSLRSGRGLSPFSGLGQSMPSVHRVVRCRRGSPTMSVLASPGQAQLVSPGALAGFPASPGDTHVLRGSLCTRWTSPVLLTPLRHHLHPHLQIRAQSWV